MSHRLCLVSQPFVDQDLQNLDPTLPPYLFYPDPNKTPQTETQTALVRSVTATSSNMTGNQAPLNGGDPNTFMPLLFAAHPELMPDFKLMAKYDVDLQRTASALEHRFRGWRKQGKEIAAKGVGAADSADQGGSPSKPGKGSKKVSNNGNGKDHDGDDHDADSSDEEGDEDADTTIPTEAGTKKRGPPFKSVGKTPANTPNKRAKKGTAQVVKKATGKKMPIKAEEMSEDGGGFDDADHDGDVNHGDGEGQGEDGLMEMMFEA